MSRPMMDPTFLPEGRRPRKAPRPPWLVPAVKKFVKLLFSRPLAPRRPREPQLPASLWHNLLLAAMRQLVFLPLAMAAMAVALVYAGTHPVAPPVTSDPAAQGVYFDPVNLASEDGTRLAGWLVPVIDARRVLDQKDRVLRERSPAVVLVHDFGRTPQQVLPMVRPLHEEGFVVLALGLRGAGSAPEGGRSSAQTLGIRESLDVQAGIDMLRRRPYVDGARIAVIGLGTGATAALLAAEHDSSLAAIVIADPVKTASDAIARRVGPREPWLTWMRPASKWAFELTYRLNADDANLDRFAELTRTRPTLRLPDGSDDVDYFDPRVRASIRNFLAANLRNGPAAAPLASTPRD